jgi:hypothetical protein
MGEGEPNEEGAPIVGTSDKETAAVSVSQQTVSEQRPGWCSFLHKDILRRLQRHLDWEDVEAEFDLKVTRLLHGEQEVYLSSEDLWGTYEQGHFFPIFI